MQHPETVIAAFSLDHAARLTGLNKAQLAQWDRIGFFRPEHAADDRRSPYSRIYSFTDIVGLKMIAILRNVHKVPLRHLKEVAAVLETWTSRPWSDMKLYVLNRRVQFQEPDSGRIVGATDGQYVLLPLEGIAESARREAEQLKVRSARQLGAVERHRHVAHNAWVASGTRIPVRTILEFVDAGYSHEAIVQEFPSLTNVDIEAAISGRERLTA